MSCLSALPEEVLKLIMQHVPLKQRLTSCCLVSKRLHAAAVAATQDLDLLSVSSNKMASALQWLVPYGQHVTSLHLEFLSEPLQQLPCPNLLDLCITSGSVQLSAADGFPGVVQNCNKLTRLLLWCNIVDFPEGGVVDGLSSLVHLQHLYMVPLNQTRLAGLSDATLPCLKHLTYLFVGSLTVENLLQLGGLTNLQELHLVAAGDTAVGPGSVPGLVFPTSLIKLRLLSPVEAGLLSFVPTGLQELQLDYDIEGPAEGPGSLLSCMARLQHLTGLELHTIAAWPPPGPAYSALAASSNLVYLEVGRGSMPEGVWPFVFSAAHTLPHLTCLQLWGSDYDDDPALTPLWDLPEISSCVSCCPSLCEIADLPLRNGLLLSELQKLTALTRLAVHCFYSSIDASVAGLVIVTQLQNLHLTFWASGKATAASLLALTNLTALKLLFVTWDQGSDGSDHDDVEDDATPYYFTTQVGSAPDVWLQLLERCAAEPGCQPKVLRSLAQQLAEQRALTAQQQQQIAGLQDQLSARLSEQGTSTTQLQQQVSEQQQRISAQDKLIAAQQQQIAGLQGQLQELHAAVRQLLPSQPQ